MNHREKIYRAAKQGGLTTDIVEDSAPYVLFWFNGLEECKLDFCTLRNAAAAFVKVHAAKRPASLYFKN